MSDELVESLRRYAETLPEANSESILKSCQNSAGITEGALWFHEEIDRAVLEKLIKRAEEISLRKVIYGKAHRKNFRNLKKGIW